MAIKEITDRLTGDFDFTLFTARFKPSFPRYERLGAVEVYRLGFGLPIDKYFLPFLGYLKARRLIKKYQIQNTKYKLLLWGMMASFGSIAAYFLKKTNPKTPFLLTLQEGDSEEYLMKGRFGLMGFWIRRVLHSADRIQVISSYLKSFAIKMGASAGRIDIIPNGVDLETFGRPVSEIEIQEIRNRLAITTDKKIIITASRLVYKNAVDTLIWALKETPNAYLIVAGSGPLENELRRLTETLNLENRMRFLGGISHKELARYFAIANVFVRPSRSEGLGSAFLEAMAAGLPIVATPVGGIPDFLKDEETGLVCEVDNPRHLASQIKRLLYNSDLRKTISANSKNLIEENYLWEKVAHSMQRIFQRSMSL